MTEHDSQAFDTRRPEELQLRVFVAQRLAFSTEMRGVVELGRQRQGEPPPFEVLTTGQSRRIIVAPLEETSISRKHVLVRVDDAGRVSIENTSGGAELMIEGGPLLRAGESHQAPPPILMRLGPRTARIERVERDQQLASLGRPTLPPGHATLSPERFRDVLEASDREGDSDKLIGWLRATMEVFQSAASSPDFLQRATKAVLTIVDLDAAAIVEPRDGDWRVRHAGFVTEQLAEDSWRPSRRMLDKVREQKSTFRYLPHLQPFEGEATHEDVVSIVAAPILDVHGALLGVLYGEKREASLAGADAPHISELEALLVELLASGVAAGLARMEQERAAVSARVQFEQFFTSDLAQQLQSDPGILEGRDALVTVLFCDIRGFSRFAERIGPEQTLAWIQDVMGELSECVLEHEGVLVDYQGDELMAMWGAPVDHGDQATRASRAAQAMLARLPALDARWEATLGGPMRVGIGVNTGVARVGNVGSQRKFKYGPLGNAVNVAARVQSATKQIGADLLLTGQTAEAMPDGTPLRRLCEVRVVNIHNPVMLCDLPAQDTPEWRQMTAQYEEAHRLAIEGDLRSAARLLGELVSAHPQDGPSLKLLARVVDAMTRPDREFDPVWELDGK